MVDNPLAKEKAHEGVVTGIVAAAGHVWTCGGSAAFVCLREWKQRGEFQRRELLKQTGGAKAMMLISPVVRVTVQDTLGSTQSVPSTSPGGSLGSGYGGPAAVEVPQSWQLLTGHANGMLQVWGLVRGVLRPLMRIGEKTSPVSGLALCEPLGLICSSHEGRVVCRALPHPRSPRALTCQFVENQVKAVDADMIDGMRITFDIKASE